MKNVKLVLPAVLALSFSAALCHGQSPAQMEADALVAKWLWAIGHEYVEGYANCYWPDATSDVFDKSGQHSVLDVKALRKRQQEWSDTMDFSKLDLNYPEPTRFVPTGEGLIVYVYVLKQFDEVAVFYFQRRNGELRILRQLDLAYAR